MDVKKYLGICPTPQTHRYIPVIAKSEISDVVNETSVVSVDLLFLEACVITIINFYF
jgi:hypothetical protein